jgi:hypothetical protein
MDKQIDKIHKQIDKNYKFIDNYVDYYEFTENDKKEFYKLLNEIIELNIEAESYCNQ